MPFTMFRSLARGKNLPQFVKVEEIDSRREGNFRWDCAQSDNSLFLSPGKSVIN